VIDPDIADDLRLLAETAGDMDFNVYSASEDGTRCVVIFYGPAQPGAYHLYDRPTKTLAYLFDYRPELKQYRFALYPDEGHGLIRPENRLWFLAMEEAFYAEHLGGRCEPVGDHLVGASLVER
jgi:hypothetical protein